jgi:RHS repeat-associated protein
VVVSDQKLSVDDGTYVSGVKVNSTPDGKADSYTADVISSHMYYAFGMTMPGRSYNSPDYKYGFNGKEKDVEGMGGGESTYDYGFRIYNPAIGRFLSVDPLANIYVYNSPYAYAENSPVAFIDLDGLEKTKAIDGTEYNGPVDINRINAEIKAKREQNQNAALGIPISNSLTPKQKLAVKKAEAVLSYLVDEVSKASLVSKDDPLLEKTIKKVVDFSKINYDEIEIKDNVGNISKENKVRIFRKITFYSFFKTLFPELSLAISASDRYLVQIKIIPERIDQSYLSFRLFCIFVYL